VEVLGHRVVEIHSYDKPVSELHTQKMYRIEEVRKEEVELDEDEAFLPIAHFHKAPGNTFGTPFVVVVKNGERLSSVIEKIQSRLSVPEKEFDKWKFAIVQAIQVLKYYSEEEDDPILFSHFFLNPSRGITFPRMGTPWFGLEHVNKNPKRMRYTVEKAIKIHN
jgi:ubiquitin carboxyl-terminal hydrolase 7